VAAPETATEQELKTMASFPPTPGASQPRLERLIEILSKDSLGECRQAYPLLVQLGDDLVGQLPSLIAKADDKLISWYASAARDLKATTAVPALIQRLEESKSRSGEFEVLQALASFDDRRAADFVLKALQSKDSRRRANAYCALPALSPGPLLDVVLKTASGAGPEGVVAVEVLGRSGQELEAARVLAARIEPVLRDPDGNSATRAAFARALAQMHPEVSGPMLYELTNDFVLEVKAAAVEGLAASPQYAPQLVRFLENSRQRCVQEACLRGLATCPQPAAVPLIAPLLDDPGLRELAHRALVQAAKGQDYGYLPFTWQGWYRSVTTAGK
jgi:HEAT repeat protein